MIIGMEEAKKAIGEVPSEVPAGVPARPTLTRSITFVDNEAFYKRGRAGLVLFGAVVTGILGGHTLLKYCNLVRPDVAKMANLFAIKKGMEEAREESQQLLAKAQPQATEQPEQSPAKEKLQQPPAKEPLPYIEASDYIMSEFKDLFKARVTLLGLGRKVCTVKMPDLNTPLPSGLEYFGEPF